MEVITFGLGYERLQHHEYHKEVGDLTPDLHPELWLPYRNIALLESSILCMQSSVSTSSVGLQRVYPKNTKTNDHFCAEVRASFCYHFVH